MARDIAITAQVSLSGSYRNTDDQSSIGVVDTLSQQFQNALTVGTSSNQVDRMFRERKTVSASGTVSYDLTALTDRLGQSVSFAKIRGILIYNRETTAGLKLNVGGNAAALATHVGDASDVIVVGPGGLLLLTSPVDGYAVTATTADILDIENPSGSSTVTYDIFMWGTSA